MKGVYRGDVRRALDACVSTARYAPYDGLGAYMRLGYVPADGNGASVSKTLEYAYDDWAIAQLARLAGDDALEADFLRRASSWRHCYDDETGFMRPKRSDGSFVSPFDAMDTHGQGFIDGNAWNYGLYVPHQPEEMITRMGGEERFLRYLDTLFVMEIDDRYIERTEDITRDGIIGSYVHGNEPGHHIPYLYNWTSEPWKTEATVRMILDRMYADATDGLCGNDDCGQMSAWYIFSAMGFYPVAPGSDRYMLGSPSLRSAVLHLDGGKTFTVTARNQSPRNVYVSSILLNGRPLQRRYITHAEITGGGELEFLMSAEPAR